MSEFVFNDIYGNEEARDRYQCDNRYAYYNTVLQMHNRYFQDNELHQEIFNHRRNQHTANSHNHANVNPLTHRLFRPRASKETPEYYSMEKINNMTFRINKRRKVSVGGVQGLNMTGRSFREQASTSSPEKKPGVSIMRDAQSLRTAICHKPAKNSKRRTLVPVIQAKIYTSDLNRK